jgi:GntR family transcriptional regulator/MocR family aminotransferase
VRIERESSTSLTTQLERQIRELIDAGKLPVGTPLPPTRQLATDLGVSRGVVVTAYEHLRHQGWVRARQGGGTQVAERHANAKPALPSRRRWTRDLHPEVTDISSFPRLAWRQAFIDAIGELPTQVLDYRSMRGIPQLREQLSVYLARVRRVCVDPEQLVVCGGLMESLTVLRMVLADFGVRTLALPRITHPGVADVLGTAGPRTAWLDVDLGGLAVDRLTVRRAQAVVVNATHQYPLGTSLAAERAEFLLNSGLLIIEDDSHAELVHDGLAEPALQSRMPDRTIHVGSFSRALAPGVRLGWIAAPPDIAKAVGRLIARSGRAPSVLEQATLARFIGTGELDRHLRILRQLYRRRARVLSGVFARELPEFALQTPTSGFHALLKLGPDHDEGAVVRAVAARGIRVFGLGAHVLHGAPPAPALVFGYAALPEGAMRSVAIELRDAIRATGHRHSREY